jgi:hypothetical protein
MFEQDRVIVRLQQRALAEAGLPVCMLSGSYGRRREDAYSDLDALLVYSTEAARDVAYSGRRQFVQSVLPYVPARSFDADHVRPHLHVALYSNGAKVDYLFESQETLRPSPWLRELRILKDSDGWGEQFQADCRQMAPPRLVGDIDAASLTQLDDRFWVMFWDVYRLLLRGDYDKPFGVYMQLIYFTIPQLLNLLPPEDPAYQGLIELQFTPDTKATLAHMKRLFQAYLAARTAVVKRHNLIFTPNQSFETAVSKLILR